MNNRINEKFEELSKSDQSAFVAYLCAGDPSYQKSLDSMHALANAGADIIEVGIPFSDPLADGIVNQMAAARALSARMDVKKTLELISDFRKNSNTPIVIFTYLNPIYNYGFEKFHDDASSAGVDGILILDLPPDEQILNVELCKNKGLLPIRLIAPTTPNERIADLLEFCNVKFEENCLNFHKSKRPVKTASSEQVRQPIYKGAMFAWKNYESELGPLIEMLEPVLEDLQKN